MEVKPFLTVEEQLELLIERGLIVEDRDATLRELLVKNYYRLSGYSLTMRKDDLFYPGSCFQDICELYHFDETFRRIIFEYSAHVEITFRSYIAYHHAEKHGPLGYRDAINFIDANHHQAFISKLEGEIRYSNDVFANHHRTARSGIFPIWVAIETTTFQDISKLYSNMLIPEQEFIAKTYYAVSRKYVASWLRSSVVARNISAHGGRFYNRNVQTTPVKLPPHLKEKIENTSPFAFAYAISRLLPSHSLKSKMVDDLSALFDNHPFALKKHVGFPEDWDKILRPSPLD